MRGGATDEDLEGSGHTRAAVLALRRFASAPTLSTFANDAITEKVARGEVPHNGGEPFEPRGTRVMTDGRTRSKVPG